MEIHAHHWIIDSANYGVCQKCGEPRQFPRFEGGVWDKGFARPTHEWDSPFFPLVAGFEKERPKE